MARRKKNKEIEELKSLLFASAGTLENEGLLTYAGRTLVGDHHQKKIARVKEIIENLK